MIKILLKATLLVCIILLIYFIVNPSACSNLMSGRVVNSSEKLAVPAPNEVSHNELLTPQGDKGTGELRTPAKVSSDTNSQESSSSVAPVVMDSTQAEEPKPVKQFSAGNTFTQADIDYNIASRYVTLEKEYLAKNEDSKDAAEKIAYIVMDDFSLTPAEWEAFLQRATADNLFEKVRQDQLSWE